MLAVGRAKGDETLFGDLVMTHPLSLRIECASPSQRLLRRYAYADDADRREFVTRSRQGLLYLGTGM